MAVHVSIHDVSPAWEREVEAALALAHSFGVRPALLVVPNFHGHAPLLDHPPFCERLRTLARQGHEIYLHGYYHQARNWADHDAAVQEQHGRADSIGHLGGVAKRIEYAFAQRIVSDSEAEFRDVSPSEAIARLDTGERMLKEAGLDARGFVAPAWSMPRWARTLLGKRGYTFTEDHTHVYDPARQQSRASLVLNFASRTPTRLVSSVAYCRSVRPLRMLFPTRIAIHPADMRYELLRREIRSLLAWARGDVVNTGSALLKR
jgi:predicted deacetylase